MRCLGATRRQILRYVRREALQWCVTAIPIGTGLSIVVVWGLCAVMRQLSNAWFGYLPVFGISWLGIGAGSVLGLITVLLAARSPAQMAAKASPLEAVTGNTGKTPHFAMGRILVGGMWETACGIYHAKSKAEKFLSDDRCVCHLHYAFWDSVLWFPLWKMPLCRKHGQLKFLLSAKRIPALSPQTGGMPWLKIPVSDVYLAECSPMTFLLK